MARHWRTPTTTIDASAAMPQHPPILMGIVAFSAMRELDEQPAPRPLTGAPAATDVFLSYSRADTEAVLRLRATLKSAGLATFLDRDQLPAGQE